MLKQLSHRWLSATIMAVAAIPALATPSWSLCVTPPNGAGKAGAIAYSPSTKIAVGYLSSQISSAQSKALAKCRQKSAATDCRVLVTFKDNGTYDTWGSVALASNGAYGSGWGYDHNNIYNGRRIADNYAIETCQQYGGVNCRVIYRLKTRNPSCNDVILNPVDN